MGGKSRAKKGRESQAASSLPKRSVTSNAPVTAGSGADAIEASVARELANNKPDHEVKETITAATPNSEIEKQVEEPVPKQGEIHLYPVIVKTQNGEKLELQLSPGDSVMDVRQFLLDAQATCFFTCYDLLLCSKDGSAHHLEDYNEISDVADITTGECHLEMTAASYDDRSIRAHVHRTRELLSLSSLHSSVSTSLALHHETGQSTSVNSRDTVKVEVADFDKLGFLEDTSDLLPDLFVAPHQEVHCVESIEFSSFNPPPSYRRLSGDLIYLDVVTLEGNKYCITGSTKHFYVNSSSPNILDPRPSKSTFEATTLAGLLQKLSSKFKKAFQEILDQRASAHPFENVQSLMPPNSWLSPHPIPGHKRDAARAESAVTLAFGSELIGMQRDWNEELQSCREFPHVKPQERILRDRALYKVTTDFVEAAVNGAVGVISRCIPPINPTDPECFHMYVHNNIFFSFAVDAEVEKLFKRQESDSVSSTAGPISSAEKDVIKEKQLADNEQATYASANNDLQGTKAYQEADIPGLYNLAMVVIDYRGHRVIAQSVLPGILQGDKSDSLLYGSVDSGKKISWTEEFHSKVTEAAKRLHLKEHSVLDGSGNAFTLAAPVECKGIVGSDDRHYLLDLMRVTPRDANYTEPGSRYCILRPELISAFCQVEATEKLKSQSKPENDAETENAAETNSEEQNTKESDSKNAIEDIRFNPNVFADVNLAGSPEEIAADEENVRKASLYLKDVVLQKFISDLYTLEVSPMDGQTLTEALHANGINVRYIGKIAEGARAFPHLWDLCSNEIIVRSAKHILKDVLRDTEDHDIGNAVVHFLNCLFGNVAKVVGSTTNSKGQKKDNSWKSAKNQEKTKKITSSWKNQSPQHSNITSDGLWSDIRDFAKFKYQFELLDDAKSRAKKIPVIRNLCLKVGIKIAARTYDLHAVAPFQVSDIMDLQPVVKHAVPFSSEARDLVECGKVHLAEGMLSEAYSSFSDAFTILQQVTGPMHREVANCCRYLAMVLYHAGDMGGAIVQQHKELIINERCLGLDHPDTAHSYGNMALFYHGLNKTELALRHMARALLLLSLSSGPDHPDIAATFINVAMMYQDIGNINKALRYLQGALEKNIMLLGGEHIQTAVCYHALAILYNCTGLYKLSLQNEQKTYDILMKKLGPDDSRTRDSQNWLNTFRMREGQANAQKQKGQVSTQKAMEIFQAHPELIHALQAVAGGGGSGGGGGTASSNGSAKSLSASIMGDSLPSRGRGVDERAARAAAEARKKAAARGLVVRPHGVSGPALPPLTRLINMINSGVQTESTNFEANTTGVNGEVKDKDKVNSSQHDVNGEVRDNVKVKVKVKVKDKVNSSQHSGNGEVKDKDKDKANSSQQHETPIGLGSGLNKKMKSKDI